MWPNVRKILNMVKLCMRFLFSEYTVQNTLDFARCLSQKYLKNKSIRKTLENSDHGGKTLKTGLGRKPLQLNSSVPSQNHRVVGMEGTSGVILSSHHA